MSEYLKPISVWWDINSCPVPTGYYPHLVGPRISSALKNAGYDGPPNITAIGNLEHIPVEVLLQINSTGIALRHVQCDYLADMVKCWLEKPMCLMLISSHEQLEIFAPTLFKIQPLLSSIVLAHPGRKEGSEWLWKTFFRSVRRELIWETLFSMDSGSADSKQLCKAGELFCKHCGPWSGSFEDFTKHIKCENYTPVCDTVMSDQPKVTMRSFAAVRHLRPCGHVPKTTVLWDMDSCPLPGSVSPSLAGRRIRSALKKSDYLGPVTITATFNLDHSPPPQDHLPALFSSGIHITNIFGYCLPQLLFAWRMSAQPPANLMLICGDTTLEMLSESLFSICDEGITILVAHPGQEPVSADLLKSFLSVVSKDWILESFLRGAADDEEDDEEEEALEYKCRKTGYVSCEMCEFSGYSLQDLATHLTSDEHLEEVSDRTPLDKHSTSAVEPKGNERETKHVAEQESSCSPRGTKRPAGSLKD